jgi:general secretion pathway protein A
VTVTDMLVHEKPDNSENDYQLKERIKNALFQKGVDENKTTVLIIDEGQKIPEFCLELMREFLNYETNDFKLLQIAIFAQKEFEKTLEKYANFTDRINLYHRLEPMSFKDTRSMIQFRLNQSSAAAKKLALFTYPAMWAIFRATRGYPRKIVNLCHRSMLAMIIQNKTKANWFLVQSCMKRAFESPRKRSWALASMFAVLVAAAIVLVPRFIPDRTPPVVIVPPASNDIATSRDKTAPSDATAIPMETDVSHAGQAQAAKTEMPSVAPLDTPPGQKAEIAYDQSSVSTAAPQKPVSSESAGATRSPSPSLKLATQYQPPAVLGQLKIRRKETLGGLIQKVYGIFNRQYLYDVMEMNPHIQDPNTIDVGELIVFPAIPLTIKPHGQNRWWIEINRMESIKEAFNILRYDRELASSSRLIPFWDKSSGLYFSIISNKYYYDEATAAIALNSLSSERKLESRLLSAWGDETVFYANPYLGP